MVISSKGVNFSSKVNTVLATLSGSLLVFIACVGLFFADSKNWFGVEGGFFPHGVGGIFKATAACFYAFQGFEIIGFSSEETENPKKVIPRAMIGTFVIVTLLYMGVAISFSLMLPYSSINKNAPFPAAFGYHNVAWIKYIVTIGPMFALFNLCILELYTLSRAIYSMSTDGLLFKFCSKVNEKTKVPLGPIFVFGPVVIALVLLTDLEDLLGFIVMYAFLQYSFFASYMIVLRYNPLNTPIVEVNRTSDTQDVEITVRSDESQVEKWDHENSDDDKFMERDTEHLIGNNCNTETNEQMELDSNKTYSPHSALNDRTPDGRNRNKTRFSKVSGLFTVSRLVVIIYLSSFFLSLQIVLGGGHIVEGNVVPIFSALSLGLIILVCSLGIFCRKQEKTANTYQVGIFVNFVKETTKSIEACDSVYRSIAFKATICHCTEYIGAAT